MFDEALKACEEGVLLQGLKVKHRPLDISESIVSLHALQHTDCLVEHRLTILHIGIYHVLLYQSWTDLHLILARSLAWQKISPHLR